MILFGRMFTVFIVNVFFFWEYADSSSRNSITIFHYKSPKSLLFTCQNWSNMFLESLSFSLFASTFRLPCRLHCLLCDTNYKKFFWFPLEYFSCYPLKLKESSLRVCSSLKLWMKGWRLWFVSKLFWLFSHEIIFFVTSEIPFQIQIEFLHFFMLRQSFTEILDSVNNIFWTRIFWINIKKEFYSPFKNEFEFF